MRPRRVRLLWGFRLSFMTADDELAAHRDGLQFDIHPLAIFMRKGDADARPGGFLGAVTILVGVNDQDIISIIDVSGSGFSSHGTFSRW